MKAQIRKEWQVALLGWSSVIVFLTAIDQLYDVWASPEHELNNHPLWALQEWGLWYLWTPLLFRLLSRHLGNRPLTSGRALTIYGLVFCNAMLYQAIFDLFVFKDSIAYSLLFFAPLHPLVIFINVFLWLRFLHTNSMQYAVNLQPGIGTMLQGPDADTESGASLQFAEAVTPDVILLDQTDGSLALPYTDIIQINAASNYVEICTTDRTWLKRATLKQIENLLPAELFVRTHRAHLVNIQFVERVTTKASGSGHVVLKCGQLVSLSKAHKHNVKARLQHVA